MVQHRRPDSERCGTNGSERTVVVVAVSVHKHNRCCFRESRTEIDCFQGHKLLLRDTAQPWPCWGYFSWRRDLVYARLDIFRELVCFFLSDCAIHLWTGPRLDIHLWESIIFQIRGVCWRVLMTQPQQYSLLLFFCWRKRGRGDIIKYLDLPATMKEESKKMTKQERKEPKKESLNKGSERNQPRPYWLPLISGDTRRRWG